MKELNKYIEESLLDNEDVLMGKLDDVAEMVRIKQSLDVSSRDKFRIGMNDLMNTIEKLTKKVSFSKIDNDKTYIIFDEGNTQYTYFSQIGIWVPDGHKKFIMHQIIFHEHTPECYDPHIVYKNTNFTVWFNSLKSEMKKLKCHDYKVIFELPAKYYWMIDWVKSQENKKY